MSFSPSQQRQQLNRSCNNDSTSIMKYSREQQKQSQQRSHSQMQMSSYESVLERAAQAHLYAQKLNNVASMCMEVGHYDKAISSLGKALRLSELHIVDQLMDRSQACTCMDCSLDGCISFSESNTNNSNLLELCNSRNNNKTETNNNKSNIKNMMFVDDAQDQEGEHDQEEQTSTIYRRPIRIPPRSISEGHNMGSTLFLIITFNLAMAHHLKAVSLSSTSHPSSISSSLIANTLQLYELTNNWQHRLRCEEQEEEEQDDYDSDDDECDDDSIMTTETTYEEGDEDQEEKEDTRSRSTASASAMNNKMNTNTTYISVRFNMILCNNLSHLHRLMKNDTMSKQCLEHLLSTVMLVIDQNKNNNKEPQQQHVTVNTNNNTIDDLDIDLDVEFEYCDDEDDDDDQQLQPQLLLPPSPRFIDVQGFVQNTSSLILQDQCADAA